MKGNKTRTRMGEHQKLLLEVRQTNEELQRVYQQLSFVTEPEMIDATIYELNAVQKRYEYLVCMMKQKQMVKK